MFVWPGYLSNLFFYDWDMLSHSLWRPGTSLLKVTLILKIQMRNNMHYEKWMPVVTRSIHGKRGIQWPECKRTLLMFRKSSLDDHELVSSHKAALTTSVLQENKQRLYAFQMCKEERVICHAIRAVPSLVDQDIALSKYVIINITSIRNVLFMRFYLDICPIHIWRPGHFVLYPFNPRDMTVYVNAWHTE